LRDLGLIFFIQKIKKQQHEQQPLGEGLIAGVENNPQPGLHLYGGPLVGRERELRSYGGEFRGLLEFLRTLRTVFVVKPEAPATTQILLSSSYAFTRAFLKKTGALLSSSLYLGYVYPVIWVWTSFFQLNVLT